MTPQFKAQQLGIKTIDSNQYANDGKQQLIEQLKSLMPSAINSDNQLDIRALQDLLGAEQTTSNNQGYELTFAGKGIARSLADSPTDQQLQVQSTQSKNFDTTDNVVIRGDNLDALKILYKNYHNKVKMIYIDPPYNTKSENFIYNDNFKQTNAELIKEFGLGEDTSNFLHNVYGTRSHSGWLSFIYPRLKLARELLTDDGVIFISIDDNEQANLKLLCDEIFGEENLMANIVWNSTKSVTSTSLISLSHNYNLIYAKDINYFIKNRKKFRLPETGQGFSNPDDDIRGPWKADPFQVGGWRPNQQYKIVNPNTGQHYLPNEGCSWKNDYSKFQELIKDNRIVFGIAGDSGPQRKRFLSEALSRGKVAKTWWDDVGATTNGTNIVKKLFNGKSMFTNPKPVDLIAKIIQLGDSDKTNIILDFFAGSGTTGEAVMQLNAEDGGQRKFILVQLDEPIAQDTAAHQFCVDHQLPPVISSITIERLNRAGDKIIADNAASKEPRDLSQLDIGYKVFTTQDQSSIVTNEQGELALHNASLTTLDKLYNMLVATCKPLHTVIEPIIADKLYLAAGEVYLIDDINPQDLEPYKANYKININAYANISLENYLNLNILNLDNITLIY